MNTVLSYIFLKGLMTVRSWDYPGTLLAEFAVMATQIILYKLVAHYLTKDAFSQYAVARRTISLLYPLLLLGLGVALPRYIGHAMGTSGYDLSERYAAATFWCVAVVTAVFSIAITVFRDGFSYLFFGSKEFEFLVFPVNLIIIGLALHASVYAFFRGRLFLKAANYLQVVNLAVVPLAALLLFKSDLRSFLTALGTLSIFVACVGFLFCPWRRMSENVLPELRQLLRYGVQRVPGDVVHMALLSLPVTAVTHVRGMRAAGSLAFSISIVAIVGAMFSPVGLVLLPKASRMLAEGSRRELQIHVSSLLKLTAVLSLGLTFILFAGATRLIDVYLGAGYNDVTHTLRLLLLAIVPYSVFLVARNVIDAYHKNAVVAVLLITAFIIFILGSALGLIFSRNWIIHSFVVAILTLGLLALVETRRICRGSNAGSTGVMQEIVGVR